MKNIVLFDLDGTLADITHRLHFIKNGRKDWDGFFEACDQDAPIAHNIAIARALHGDGNEIWITSGRSGLVLEKTRVWLKKYAPFSSRLIMRKAGDHQPDDTLKESWIKQDSFPTERVICAF